MEIPAPPLFRAMATSTRPIYQLLRCVSFSNKVHVEISNDGIKFIADHTRVMQGTFWGATGECGINRATAANIRETRHGVDWQIHVCDIFTQSSTRSRHRHW